MRAAAGIIGTADLLKFGAEVEPLLVACKGASPNYRGIRCNAAHDPLMAKGGNFHPTPGMYSVSHLGACQSVCVLSKPAMLPPLPLNPSVQSSSSHSCQDPKFREGFALLGKHELVFDAFVFATQLGEVNHVGPQHLLLAALLLAASLLLACHVCISFSALTSRLIEIPHVKFRELAKVFPQTTIVLDHAGSPLAALGNYAGAAEYDGKQAETLAAWKEE